MRAHCTTSKMGVVNKLMSIILVGGGICVGGAAMLLIRHTRRGGLDWSVNWLLTIPFKPRQQTIHAVVDPVPIPEPVRSDGHKLSSWFRSWLIAKKELARELFRSANQVRYSFRVLGFLFL